MRRLAALLAAVSVVVTLSLTVIGCGGSDGAEPGAPSGASLRDATLVLDFLPNAAHSGLYLGQADGLYAESGVDLAIQIPGNSTDAPKLLEAGKTDFAVMDIHDLGLARERGLDIVGLTPIVGRPLASVIAADRTEIRTPADLVGKVVGVTGLPSDDAVLDSVLDSAGVDPSDVDTVTIGFNAVSALAAGKVDASTAFWNVEGVQLQDMGVPTRVFRVDDFGAPRYPELVLVTSASEFEDDPGLVRSVVLATQEGYAQIAGDPQKALGMADQVKGLDREALSRQVDAMARAHAFAVLGGPVKRRLEAWSRWDVEHGILDSPADIGETFDLAGFGG